MPETKEQNKRDFHMRASLPVYFRYVALGALGMTLLAVIVGFYRERSKTPFKLKAEHSQLSTDVTGEVNGYERLESDGDMPKYYIKADHVKSFSDNHQELDNIYLRIYDKDGNPADTMTAQKGLYVPEPDKNFTVYLNGGVNIETRDELKVKTNNIIYSKANETVDADEAIEFERGTIRGRSVGATVKIAEKRLELPKQVEVETFESPELARSGVRYAKINADSASFDQSANKIDLNSNVVINIQTGASGESRTTDVRSGRAVFEFINVAMTGSGPNAQVKRLEMSDGVHITSAGSGATPTNIDAGRAIFDKSADRYELADGVRIITSANEKATDIKASNAIYDQQGLKVSLSGGAEIVQGEDYIKGDVIEADLFADKKIRYAVVRGDGVVRQTTDERTTTIVAPEMNISYNDVRQLQNANAIGRSTLQLVPNGNADYSLVTFIAPTAIHVVFKGPGSVDNIQTDGRTSIQMDVPNNRADAADKRITADTVRAFFNDNGKDLRRAEAAGNAELYIEPLRAGTDNYRTTINAPRFDCEFYPTGSNAKICSAGKSTKTVRVPTMAANGHDTQTMIADRLNVTIGENSKDIDSMEAAGNTRFTELDRTATATTLTYTKSDEIVRLRGGEPTVWDNNTRGKAREIDWDTRNKRSYFRGGVSTTYYSRRKTGDSVPFSSDKPVYVTADNGEFDHATEAALFTGNARGWQDSNFVRADRLLIQQHEGRLLANGNVQSSIYDVKQKRNGRDKSVPVFAAARGLSYDRETRMLKYREDVDIRQGTDRVTAGSADIFLNEKNEVAKTVVETNVVIIQPGRRATGDWAQYTADDDVAILRGDPATVNDSENGSSQNGEITVYMRDNRVIASGRTKQNAGARSRSVYKVKSQP